MQSNGRSSASSRPEYHGRHMYVLLSSYKYWSLILRQYPTTISITVFNPDSLAASIGHAQSGQTRRTRRRYARIQTVFTGVRTPGGSGDFDPIWYHQVPMTLKLEPLYFGALPQSVIPIVCAIAAAIVLGYPVANRISEILRGLAEDIRQNESKPTKID